MKQLEFNFDLPAQFAATDINTVTNLREIEDWLDYLENLRRYKPKGWCGWFW